MSFAVICICGGMFNDTAALGCAIRKCQVASRNEAEMRPGNKGLSRPSRYGSQCLCKCRVCPDDQAGLASRANSGPGMGLVATLCCVIIPQSGFLLISPKPDAWGRFQYCPLWGAECFYHSVSKHLSATYTQD